MVERTRRMSKHTKGPWITDHAVDYDVIEITSEAREGMVPIARIDIGFEDEFDNEQLSNAELIVFAPEMYEALDAMKGHLKMLSIAVNEGDPKGEIALRVNDMSDLVNNFFKDGKD